MSFEKRFIVLANWKMHKTLRQSIDYVRALKEGARQLDGSVETILCIPFTVLAAVAREIDEARISLGAQNVHEREWGAYTGEISPLMLADAGARYCMVGHSERRKYFFETDEMVNRKARTLHGAGIVPIVCIGETIDEREKGLTLNKLEKQTVMCFDGFSPQEMEKTAILYEPIWAIGTGKIATPKQAQEAHHFIREMVQRLFSEETAFMTRIVYGGSVKWNNVSAMLTGENIDGVGVGSDSLDVQNFLKIAESCAQWAKKRKRND